VNSRKKQEGEGFPINTKIARKRPDIVTAGKPLLRFISIVQCKEKREGSATHKKTN